MDINYLEGSLILCKFGKIVEVGSPLGWDLLSYKSLARVTVDMFPPVE